MKNTQLIFCLMIAALAIFSGCKKESNTATYGRLWFHIHYNIDTTEAEVGEVYSITDSVHTSTRNITIDTGSYTITNIKMINTAGESVAISGDVHVIAGTEQYEVGAIPTGTYKSITFDVKSLIVGGKVGTGSSSTFPNTPYAYTQTTASTVALPAHSIAFTTDYEVKDNQSTFVHLIGDHAILLYGIDIDNVHTTTASVTSHFNTNIPKMFRYEE